MGLACETNEDVSCLRFCKRRNGGYLLWLETHARAIKPLEGEEQCAIEVELHCLIQESCADRLTISEV